MHFDRLSPIRAVTGVPVPVYSLTISSAIIQATFSGSLLRKLPAMASFSISVPTTYSSRSFISFIIPKATSLSQAIFVKYGQISFAEAFFSVLSVIQWQMD
jgi:hypothetical protein